MCVECERGVWQHGGRMFKVTLALAIVRYGAVLGKHLRLPSAHAVSCKLLPQPNDFKLLHSFSVLARAIINACYMARLCNREQHNTPQTSQAGLFSTP